jgi:hypothetical protein
LFADLFGRVLDDACEVLEGLDGVQYLRRLQTQHDAAAKQQRLASARIAELQGKRDAIEIELPENLAQKIRYIDGKLGEQRQLLEDAERDLTTLNPLLEKALVDAESVMLTAFFPVIAAAKEKAA